MIETTVPIPISELKTYFQDKTATSFLIDYENSTLKGEKFLTYMSNLDVPADIKVNFSTDSGRDLLAAYFAAPNLVKLEALEKAALSVLLEARGLGNFGFSEFIEANGEKINDWLAIIDSLTVYNLFTIDAAQLKEKAKSFPINQRDDVGVNFVNLLKYEQTFALLEKLDRSNLAFYSALFEKYMFKGQNLFSFWANPNNPLFLLTTGIAAGKISHGEMK